MLFLLVKDKLIVTAVNCLIQGFRCHTDCRAVLTLARPSWLKHRGLCKARQPLLLPPGMPFMDLCLLFVMAKAFGGFTPPNCSNNRDVKHRIMPVKNRKYVEEYQWLCYFKDI